MTAPTPAQAKTRGDSRQGIEWKGGRLEDWNTFLDAPGSSFHIERHSRASGPSAPDATRNSFIFGRDCLRGVRQSFGPLTRRKMGRHRGRPSHEKRTSLGALYCQTPLLFSLYKPKAAF